MAEEGWHYAQVRNHLVRWRGSDDPGRVPSGAEVLTPRGWRRANTGLPWFLSQQWRGRTDDDHARRLKVYACVDTSLNATARMGVWSRLAASGPRWFISPPPPMGAPRYFPREREEAAEREFREETGDTTSERVLVESIAGWERICEQNNSIESRSQVFLQVAGVTTTLVLANGALLTGKNRESCAVIVALVLASVAFSLAGIYGLLGSMYTFDRIDPDNVLRVIDRAEDERTALEKRVAAMFLATRRTSHVVDWKLARLRRAMWCLLIGVLGLAFASGAVVIDAFA